MDQSSHRSLAATTRPNTASFYSSILECLPTPVVVLDAVGRVEYANTALAGFLGHDPSIVDDWTIFDIVYPDDRSWATTCFLDRRRRDDPSLQRSSSTRLRFVSASGEPLVADVSSSKPPGGNTSGPTVLQLRPAADDEILANILSGVSSGAEEVDLLGLLVQFVATQSSGLDALVLQRSGGQWNLMASTSTLLSEAFGVLEATEFGRMASRPEVVEHGSMSDHLRDGLTDLDIDRVWRLSVDSDLIDDGAILRYEIVVCTTSRLATEAQIVNRLRRAGELARIVMRGLNERRLWEVAHLDELTGVLNRSALQRAIGAIPVNECRARNTSLIFLDLDGFKPVNDMYGHATGDRVLKVVAERITSAVRTDDVVARLGGDEFVVLLRDTDPNPDIQQMIAERIVNSISRPISVSDVSQTGVDVSQTGVDVSQTEVDVSKTEVDVSKTEVDVSKTEVDVSKTEVMVSVGVSAGVAIGVVDETLDALMARADRLMYEAKAAGGAQVRLELTRTPVAAEPMLDDFS